jgi:hypothetical protein
MVVITLSELMAVACILFLVGSALWDFTEKEVKKSKYKKEAKKIDKDLEELYINVNGSLKEMIKHKPPIYTSVDWRQLVETYVEKLDKESKEEDVTTQDFWK